MHWNQGLHSLPSLSFYENTLFTTADLIQVIDHLRVAKSNRPISVSSYWTLSSIWPSRWLPESWNIPLVGFQDGFAPNSLAPLTESPLLFSLLASELLVLELARTHSLEPSFHYVISPCFGDFIQSCSSIFYEIQLYMRFPLNPTLKYSTAYLILALRSLINIPSLTCAKLNSWSYLPTDPSYSLPHLS